MLDAIIDTSDDLSSVSRKPGRKPMPDDDELSQDVCCILFIIAVNHLTDTRKQIG